MNLSPVLILQQSYYNNSQVNNFDWSRFIWLAAALAVALVVMAGVAAALRRYTSYQQQDEKMDMGIGFSLSDLNMMHKSGKLTDEEFETAKEKLIARSKDYLAEAEEVIPKPNIKNLQVAPATDASEAENDSDEDSGEDSEDASENDIEKNIEDVGHID